MGLSRLQGVVVPENQIPLSSIGMQRFNSKDFPDIPQIAVTGAFSLAYSVNADQGVNQDTYHFVDTLSWMKGKHQIRTGMELRRYVDDYYSNNRFRGTLSIQSFGDFLLGLSGAPLAQGGNGTGFSNINTSSVASGVTDRMDRVTDLAFFVQDDWKLSSRLTLNLGLRWDYLGYAVDKLGRNGSFDTRLYKAPPDGGFTSAGFVQTSSSQKPIAGIPKVSNTLLDSEPNRNFAPRIGFAYKIADKLAMRGGYGIYYDRLSNPARSARSAVVAGLRAYRFTGLREPFVLAAESVSDAAPAEPVPGRTAALRSALHDGPPGNRLECRRSDVEDSVPAAVRIELAISITPSTLLEAGFSGTKGSRLATQRLINQPILASATAPVNGQTTNTSANAGLRVPYIGFSPTGLVWLETSTDSRYNSLQTSLTRRFSKGLRALASYTWSKSLDNNSGSGTGATFTQTDGDQTRLALNRGLSDFDRTHRVVVNFSYDIPKWGFGMNDTAIGKRLFGGWQIAGVAVAQSGTPFSILDTSGAAFYGTANSRASWAAGATIESAQLSGRTQDRLDKYFDTAAFVRAGNLFGDSGRNILRGPSQRNLDISINKRIAITERVNLEWRSEFFNILNITNFANPGSSITASSYGTIRSTTGNPRVIQFALKLAF